MSVVLCPKCGGQGHVSVSWRFVLDEADRVAMEAARVASDERTRLALDKLRRLDDVLPAGERDDYLDLTSEMDGLTVRLRIYCHEEPPSRITYAEAQ